jgi:hypothetical protein
MNIDETIAFTKTLIAKREEIDRQLAELFGGVAPAKKGRACKRCGEPGHDVRSCPQPEKPAEPSKSA